MITFLEKLKTDAWRTAGARYNASRRLRRREIFASVSFAFMSTATVAAAYAQRVYAPPASPLDNYLSVISASLGVLLLTVGLIEWGAKTGAMAEALYQNAEKLNAFRRRLELCIAVETANASLDQIGLVRKMSDEYAAIKGDCLHNHMPIDDLYFRFQHKDSPEFSSLKVPPVRAWCFWQIASIWYIAGLWILLIALALPLLQEKMWQFPSA